MTKIKVSTVYALNCQGAKPKMSLGPLLVTYVDDWITTAVHYSADIKGCNP